MPNNPLIVIRQLAKRFEGKVKSVNLYDANVCNWVTPPDIPWAPRTVSGEPFSKQLRYRYRDRPVRMLANNRFLNGAISGSFPFESLTVNERNLVFPNFKCATEIILDGKRVPIFTAGGHLSESQGHLLTNDAFTSVVKDFCLGPNEKLDITSESISFYFKEPTLSRVIKAVDDGTRFAEHFEIPGTEPDFRVLPVQFQPLIPLIKKWAIGDDQDRMDFQQSQPRQVLRAFVVEVEPYLDSIDSYLDSFGDQPPTEEATALGRLAECAVEVKRLLQTSR